MSAMNRAPRIVAHGSQYSSSVLDSLAAEAVGERQ
jgi:hypothetical protein